MTKEGTDQNTNKASISKRRRFSSIRAIVAFVLLVSLGVVMLSKSSFADDFAYVLDADRNVAVISRETNTVVANIRVGLDPRDIAITPDGALIYVPNLAHNTVSVISTATNTVVATVGVSDRPVAVVITPDGSLVYVVHNSQFISVISTATNMVEATVDVGNLVAGVAFKPLVFTPDSAFAYVLVPFQGVKVVSTTTNSVVDTIPNAFVANPLAIAITPDGALAYVSEFNSAIVSVISIASNTVIANVGLDFFEPAHMAITPDSALVYMMSLQGFSGIDMSVVSTASNTEVAVVPVITEDLIVNIKSIVIAPDGSLIYITFFGFSGGGCLKLA